MSEVRRTFDWASFVVRVGAIAGSATWMLIWRLGKHDRVGAMFVVGFGYVIFPVLAYFYTRYYNLLFMSRIVKAVWRLVGRVGAR